MCPSGIWPVNVHVSVIVGSDEIALLTRIPDAETMCHLEQ